MLFYNPKRHSFALIAVFSFACALNLASSFGQESEPSNNESSGFNATPPIDSIFDVDIQIPGFEQPPIASYAVPHEFDSKGGGVVYLLPAIVFKPRNQNEECIVGGNCDEDVKTEIQSLLASDPLLQVVHEVKYDQKMDELEALFEIQFYPEQFRQCVAKDIETKARARDLTQGKRFSIEPLNLRRHGGKVGICPRLEFRLDRGNGNDDFRRGDPNLLACRIFNSGDSYNGTAKVGVVFCRFKGQSTKNDKYEKQQSSLDSFRVFCKNCSDVKAQLNYYYVANLVGQGSSKIKVSFEETQKILSELETIAARQGDSTSLPIVDRDTMNNYVRQISEKIENTVVIDSNGDTSLQKMVTDSLNSQMTLTQETVSKLLVKEFKYDEQGFDSVLEKYLEPIIRAKISNAIESKEDIEQNIKTERIAALRDINVQLEKDNKVSFGLPKVDLNLFKAIGIGIDGRNNQSTFGQFLGVDSGRRQNEVTECSKATSDRINQAQQSVNNSFEMDCKDFSLYELNVGMFRAHIEMLQNFIVARKNIARETTGLVPLSVTTDAIEKGDFRDIDFYRRNYEELKKEVNKLRMIINPNSEAYTDI